MFFQSILPVLGRFLLTSLLTALGTRPASAIADAWMIKLFTAGPNPITPGVTPTAFTEAAFTGYAAVAFAPTGAIINLPSGQGLGIIGNAAFVCSATGTPESILGYYVVDGSGTPNFIMGELFAAPANIVNPGDFIDLNVVVPQASSVPVS